MAAKQGGRTAFVTGGTGFVGRHVIDVLVERGWSVTVLHRPTSDVTYLETRPVSLVEGDVTVWDSLAGKIPPRTDAVFHVAADISLSSRDKRNQSRVNVLGTRNMVEAAIKAEARHFILTSTVSAYGRQSRRINEQTPSVASRSWINYERSKWLAEEEVRKGRARGLEATIIQPCAILGPGDTRGWAQFFFLLKEGQVKAIPPGIATFNHVREVAKAHVAAAELEQGNETFLLSGEEAPFSDMVRIMAELMGVPLKAPVMPPRVLRLVARLSAVASFFTRRPPQITPEMAALVSQSVLCDTTKAERLLGYRPVPLRTCLEDSHAWLCRHGRL